MKYIVTETDLLSLTTPNGEDFVILPNSIEFLSDI